MTTDNETVLREALGRCVAALKEAHYTGHEVNGHEIHDAAILAGVEALSRPASAPEGVVEALRKDLSAAIEREADDPGVELSFAMGMNHAAGIVRTCALSSSVSVDEGGKP